MENSRRNTGKRDFFQLLSLLIVVLVAVQASYFFSAAHFETGDFAVNALQIEKARQGQELHGHYSRWGFHHPGPAYFYFYALGQFVFFELLPLVPTAYNAHALTGLLIQALFFTVALFLFARQTRLAFFVPLALLFSALHLGLAGSAFYSIWPPHTLLFPFLAFLVACAALAAGNAGALVVVVTAGSLLVHNYIAQPLFVLPLSAVAYGGLLRQVARPGLHPREIARRFWRQHLLALLLLLLFLTPLLLDASMGRESNLAAILRHLRYSQEERKTLGQSLLYFFSFLGYAGEPARYVNQSGWEGLRLLAREKWPFCLGWGVALVAPALLWGRKIRREGTEAFIFVRRIYLFVALAILLGLVWGMLQVGVMYRMNGYFFFALLLLPLWLLAAALASALERYATLRRVTGALILALALTGVVFRQQQQPSFDWDRQAVAEALQQEEDRPIKYLIYDREEWPLAAAVALEVRRQGYDFRVGPGWEFMFTPSATLYHPDEMGEENISIWRLDTEGQSAATTLQITVQGQQLPRVALGQTDISFGEGGNAPLFLGTGWGPAEGALTWSWADAASLHFRPARVLSDVVVQVDGKPYVWPGEVEQQTLLVSFNGQQIYTTTLSTPEPLSFVIPRALWNSSERATLRFEFPDAVTIPHFSKVYGDYRRLGFGFKAIRFRQR